MPGHGRREHNEPQSGQGDISNPQLPGCGGGARAVCRLTRADPRGYPDAGGGEPRSAAADLRAGRLDRIRSRNRSLDSQRRHHPRHGFDALLRDLRRRAAGRVDRASREDLQQPVSGADALLCSLSVDDGDVIRIYFDNPGASDASNPTGVWDANYQGVYHLNSTVFGTNTILDSTINGNNGTPTGTVSSETVGPIGKATRFAASSNIMFPINLMSNMNAVGTVSVFVNLDNDTGLFPMTFSQRSGANAWEMFFQLGLSDIVLRYGDGFVEADADIPGQIVPGQNHILTAIWDQPNSRLKIFVDGDNVLDNTIASWTLNTTDDKTGIGNVDPPLGNTSLVGFEDEARFSNIVRSDDSIKTEANNQLNPGAFYSTGVVESVPATTIAMGYQKEQKELLQIMKK